MSGEEPGLGAGHVIPEVGCECGCRALVLGVGLWLCGGGASQQQQVEVQCVEAGDWLLPVVEGGELGQLQVIIIQFGRTFPHFPIQRPVLGFRLSKSQVLELGQVHGGDGLPPEQERVELAARHIQHFNLQVNNKSKTLNYISVRN